MLMWNQNLACIAGVRGGPRLATESNQLSLFSSANSFVIHGPISCASSLSLYHPPPFFGCRLNYIVRPSDLFSLRAEEQRVDQITANVVQKTTLTRLATVGFHHAQCCKNAKDIKQMIFAQLELVNRALFTLTRFHPPKYSFRRKTNICLSLPRQKLHLCRETTLHVSKHPHIKSFDLFVSFL